MSTIKKTYSAPSLEVFGTVADLTEAFGDSQATDYVFIGGANFGTTTSDPIDLGTTGSRDGIIVPN